jgi:hypothetical protein
MRPILTYSSETWLPKKIFNSETVGIRKENSTENIRTHKKNQLRRIKTNDELDKLIKHRNIINHIKSLRLSSFGYVQRMPDSRTVKKIFNWTSLNARSKGRPQQRWKTI